MYLFESGVLEQVSWIFVLFFYSKFLTFLSQTHCQRYHCTALLLSLKWETTACWCRNAWKFDELTPIRHQCLLIVARLLSTIQTSNVECLMELSFRCGCMCCNCEIFYLRRSMTSEDYCRMHAQRFGAGTEAEFDSDARTSRKRWTPEVRATHP